ncbi:MAG: hypothetical protein ACLPV4_18980 [Solirubrobacteraceae bacterium]
MTLIVIGNIVLMTTIAVGIVGLLAASIHTSRLRVEARRVVQRAPRQRPARARAYRSYEGLNA